MYMSDSTTCHSEISSSGYTVAGTCCDGEDTPDGKRKPQKGNTPNERTHSGTVKARRAQLHPPPLLSLLLSISVFSSLQDPISAKGSGSFSAIHRHGMQDAETGNSMAREALTPRPRAARLSRCPLAQSVTRDPAPGSSPLGRAPDEGGGAHHVVVSAVWSSFPP